MDYIKLQAYIGLLRLAGVCKSHNEAMENLWNERNCQHIFRLTMSMKRFKIISRIIRFDNLSKRTHRRQTDKLAPIRELWNKWVASLPKLFNPNENVTVDKQLVGFGVAIHSSNTCRRNQASME